MALCRMVMRMRLMYVGKDTRDVGIAQTDVGGGKTEVGGKRLWLAFTSYLVYGF